MTDQLQASSPPTLAEEEKALLRRCYRIRRITDDEIVFPIEAANMGRAGWLTMLWFLLMGCAVVLRWTEVPRDAPSAAWMLLGAFPTFLLMWLAGRRPTSLIVKRGGRSMEVVLHDGRWAIQLPHGTSPTEWDFPTAKIPVRWKSDEVERVSASEILEHFSGSSPSEPCGGGFLPLLEQCNADVVGYDEGSVSIANFGSARQWVVAIGLGLLMASPVVGMFWRAFGSDEPKALLICAVLSAFGGAWVMYDGRASSVATLLKGKRQVRLLRRGVERTLHVHEDAVRVVTDGDAGELVIVEGALSFSPICGTANLLAGFLRKYVIPPATPSKGPGPTTTET